MKNYLHEPDFFTPPSGDTKRPRTLYKSGGGDGGAAKRKAAEDARVAEAIKQINAIFAIGKFDPDPVDKNAYMREAQTQQQSIPGFGFSRPQQPIDVPEGFELVSQGSGISRIPGYMGGFNGLNINQDKQFLFDKKGYEKAVAAAQAEAKRKNESALQQRDGLYTKIGNDATNTALTDLNKDRTGTERELNFMLARQGLSGGSRDIDVNRDVLDTYQQGVLKASNLGLQASNNARSADDRTRVNMINSIRSGLDEGSAMQQAYEGMRNNARAAQDDANATSLAGFFDVLKNQQQAAAYSNGVNSVSGSSPQTKSTPYSSAINGDRGRTSSY